MIELETRKIIHFNDGYRGTITIKDNPDAPDLGFMISVKEKEAQETDLLFPIMVIDALIKQLQGYKDALEKKQ